jgi:hypothetical protein
MFVRTVMLLAQHRVARGLGCRGSVGMTDSPWCPVSRSEGRTGEDAGDGPRLAA